MTHTNFKRTDGLPQCSTTGKYFIRSKGVIFVVDPNEEEQKNHKEEQSDQKIPQQQ